MNKRIKNSVSCFCRIVLLWLCLANVGVVYAQKTIRVLKGKVVEKIQRHDGEVIYIPVEGAKVYVNNQTTPFVFTNMDGLFELDLKKNVRKNEKVQVFIKKNKYAILFDHFSFKTIPYLEIINNKENQADPNNLFICLTKNIQKYNTTNSGESISLSGYITFNNQFTRGVEIKVKGIDEVHDNTNEDGYFEVYLPKYRFNPDKAFTLLLKKGASTKEVVFKNIEDFNAKRKKIVFAKKANTAKKPKPYVPPTVTNTTNGTNHPKEVDINEISFRRFIATLDDVDFNKLGPQEINALKDSLSKYADYLSVLKEEVEELQKRPQSDSTILKFEKELTETHRKLTEKEKELIKVELANSRKTVIILSLLIVLMLLATVSYYYFYVYKKIHSQAEELDKRNQFIEFLLRELNHRVTNNLQVISSMLRRKIRRLSDDVSKEALQEINQKVKNIATIHVGLYSKQDDKLTRLDNYLKNITETLEKLYNFDTPIKITIEAPNIEVSQKNAVFFGLIINELATNAFKYAFDEVDNPELMITLKNTREKKFSIQVKDNGKGIPDDFKLEEAKSSGLKLVNLITKMLNGSFKIINNKGTQFELTLEVR